MSGPTTKALLRRIAQRLTDSDETLACVEIGSGGDVTRSLTSEPGSSAFFAGSFILSSDAALWPRSLTPVDCGSPGRPGSIFASKTDIRLLLAKIIENSVQAVEGLGDRNGTIKIDTARKNDEILVTIIDNGVGITPERRAKVFKPFYTSRDGAMGLGLTLAGHLARKYEGGIKINSLPGQGTVTRVTLPTDLPES